MASIRTLKSDIKYLISEVVADCANVVILHPEKKDETLTLIEKAIDLYSDCLSKINNGKGQNKAYFNEIKNTLLNEADAIYNQLRSIIGAK